MASDRLFLALSMSHIPHLAEQFVLSLLLDLPEGEKEMWQRKKSFAGAQKCRMLTNIELLDSYRTLLTTGKIEHSEAAEKLLRRRGVRSESGVSVITLLTKPYPCPGKCVYCPTEYREGKMLMPKSYLSNEPAAMRALLNQFDPYFQVRNRLASLVATGHHPSKVELIVIGGTFSFLPQRYATNYLRQMYGALNESIANETIDTGTEKGLFRVVHRKQKPKFGSLAEEIEKNETAPHRCVGLTLETRPDYITENELKYFRKVGCTRVELGVQTLDDEISKLTKRGHMAADVAKATQLLKDAGFKVAFHLMPNLPGSTPEKDIAQAKEMFENEAYKPDLLKIYPCSVTKEAELYEWWRAGKFTPYDDETLAETLCEMKRFVPRYCRITRLIRDIPAESIMAGSTVTNLRQLLEKRLVEKGISCQCIRCREIREVEFIATDGALHRLDFDASGGKEVFLSFDDPVSDKLIALLRLRLPSQVVEKKRHFIRALQGAAIIREVHTYGEQSSVGSGKGKSQHLGFGARLIAEAERIAREEWKVKKLAVIAGVGVREYYRRLGYEENGTYMVKKLDIS